MIFLLFFMMINSSFCFKKIATIQRAYEKLMLTNINNSFSSSTEKTYLGKFLG